MRLVFAIHLFCGAVGAGGDIILLMATSKHPIAHASRRRIILLAALLLLLYVVGPQVGGFSDSWQALKTADGVQVGLAVIVMQAGSFVAAAGMYQSLSKHRLRFRQTLLVQLAGGFASRLLPAGLGGLTLNVQYLRKSKHTLSEALAVAGMNNSLGFVAHMLLLAGIVLLVPEARPQDVELHALPSWVYIGLGVVGVLVVWALTIQRVRRYLYHLTSDTVRHFAAYRRHPQKLLGAFGCALLVTACYVSVLWLCAHAIGEPLDPLQAFIIFSAGMLVGTATPTPGGLIGAEAGLAAGSMAYGVESTHAIAIALLYRLITYWLPMLPGFVAFLRVRAMYL